jgi:hypothetical protein
MKLIESRGKAKTNGTHNEFNQKEIRRIVKLIKNGLPSVKSE